MFDKILKIFKRKEKDILIPIDIICKQILNKVQISDVQQARDYFMPISKEESDRIEKEVDREMLLKQRKEKLKEINESK